MNHKDAKQGPNMNFLFSLILLLHSVKTPEKATVTPIPVATRTPDSASPCDAQNHGPCPTPSTAGTQPNKPAPNAATPAVPDADPKVVDAALSVAMRACAKHPDATVQLDKDGQWFEAPCSSVLAVLQQHPDHPDFFDKTQELIDVMNQTVTDAVKTSEQHTDPPAPACKVPPATAESQ
jgi:hypothetical protein